MEAEKSGQSSDHVEGTDVVGRDSSEAGSKSAGEERPEDEKEPNEVERRLVLVLGRLQINEEKHQTSRVEWPSPNTTKRRLKTEGKRVQTQISP